MTKNSQSQQYESRSSQQPIVSEQSVGKGLNAVLAISILLFLATIVMVYLSYLIHSKVIPSLSKIVKNYSLFKNRNRPQLTPDQESEIKGYMRYILASTKFNRVSLYFLDAPYFNEDYIIQADSFSLWIEASKSIPMRKDTKLSYAYISEELNRIIADKIKYKHYENATKGLVCQVWLRDRATISYTFYVIYEFGFLLLEKTKSSFLSRIISAFKRVDDANYIESCALIGHIINEQNLSSKK